jgi:hypothetical protein
VGLTDIFTSRPSVAYLFPELDPLSSQTNSTDLTNLKSSIFVFQYWPTQIQDSYSSEYASKIIPGGSHPLYQYIAGNGRTISFEAIFTAELDEDSQTDFQATPGGGGNTGVVAALLPSSRYTVNVAAAVNKLQSYQYPSYSAGVASPPPKLTLVIPGSRIGRGKGKDSILCFLRSARVTQESSFPTGTLRIATVALEFVETVQLAGQNSSSTGKIQFIDGGNGGTGTTSSFYNTGDYTYRGNLTGQ